MPVPELVFFMEYVIDKLKSENIAILKRRPDLNTLGDWTKDSEKLFANEEYINKLNQLPIRLVIGTCSCRNQIVRDEVIKYCAWCHKQIEN